MNSKKRGSLILTKGLPKTHCECILNDGNWTAFLSRAGAALPQKFLSEQQAVKQIEGIQTLKQEIKLLFMMT
jgi:hypothetical protein